MLFVGDDWAEEHHDVELVDDAGRRLARARLPEGLEGLSRLHALIAEHLPQEWADLPAEEAARRVVVGIETDRGPWVQALLAAGYVVFAINPMQVARYRERHSTSGAKSDAGDAHVLAEIVRLDREHHRPVAGDSPNAEAVKLLARTHQSMIWDRTRQVLQPVRGRLPDVLGDRPAVRSRQPGQQPDHERPGPPPRLHPREPTGDPAHQLLEHHLPPGRVYALPRGHRRIVWSRHNPR